LGSIPLRHKFVAHSVIGNISVLGIEDYRFNPIVLKFLYDNLIGKVLHFECKIVGQILLMLCWWLKI
jgi:hypothetical protein